MNEFNHGKKSKIKIVALGFFIIFLCVGYLPHIIDKYENLFKPVSSLQKVWVNKYSREKIRDATKFDLWMENNGDNLFYMGGYLIAILIGLQMIILPIAGKSNSLIDWLVKIIF